MIRIILVAMTVVLRLIFSVPILTMLRLRAKGDPVGIQEKGLSEIQGVFRFVLELIGVTYEMRGLKNVPSDRAVFYMGNHKSYSDILIDHVTIPGLTGFMAKKEMLEIPPLHTWMQRVNCLLLGRVDIRERLRTTLEGIEKVKSGISVWIFPEGARNEDQELTGLLPSHEGSLETAQKSGCPVIPVAITGTAEIFEQHLSFVKPSHMCMYYGMPIYIKELLAKKRELPEVYTRDVIAGVLRDMKEGQEQNK